MLMSQLIPVILCGGNGTRLWPLSREHYPKQFLSLFGDSTLLQQTVQRIPEEAEPAIFVTNENHRFLVAEQLLQINYQPQTILLEPEGKNTAPAIAIAAMKALEKYDNPQLLILAADHYIEDEQALNHAIKQASIVASNGKLATFGIVPTHPETGYGYIKCNKQSGEHYFPIEKFVEKPDFNTAETYLASGNYYWNSGMFLFNARTILEQLSQFTPDIVQVCQQTMATQQHDLDFTRIDATSFAHCPADSIDYAVMERTQDAVVIPLNAGWSDVGSWSSVWSLQQKDESNNACMGDVITRDSENNLVHSSDRLVSLCGVNDLIVVATPDAVMVADKHQGQAIKEIVSTLKADNRQEHQNHRQVFRPWGNYDSLVHSDKFQVKHISVKPGERLSLQRHQHRAEHWVVVSGIAKVTKGDAVFTLRENESTYIPKREIHCLENPGEDLLEIIEIQSGDYLGEDDIERFDDKYGRG